MRAGLAGFRAGEFRAGMFRAGMFGSVAGPEGVSFTDIVCTATPL